MSKHSITIQTTTGPKVLPIRVESLSGKLYKASLTCICLKSLSHQAGTEEKAVAGLKADYKPHLERDIQAVRDFLKELDAHQRVFEAKSVPRRAMDRRMYDTYMRELEKRRRK